MLVLQESESFIDSETKEVRWRTKGPDGQRLIVAASLEARSDFRGDASELGAAVARIADRKLRLGEVEPDGRVLVRTAELNP